MIRRKRLLIVVLTLLLVILVACGDSVTETPPTEAPATEALPETPASEEPIAEPTEEPQVTLVVWYLSESPEEITLMERLVGEFDANYSNIIIDFSVFNFDNMSQALQSALSDGAGPDVAYASPGPRQGGAYAAEEYLLNLTDIAAELGWDNRFSDDIIAVHNGPGQIYMMPYDLVTVGVYYNTETFDQLELEPPETFEEFENILATINDADIIPISVGVFDGRPVLQIWEQLIHASVPIENIGKIESGDPAARLDTEYLAATMKLQEWNQSGYFQDNALSTSYAESSNLFTAGEAAMIIDSSANKDAFSTQSDFEAGFFAMPRLNPDIEWHMGGYTPNNVWMIPTYSKHQDIAVVFLNFVLGEEVATAKWAAGDMVAYTFAEMPPPVSGLQADIYTAMRKTGTGYYINSNYSDLQSVTWTSLQELIVGALSPEELMARVQAKYVELTQ